MGLFDSIKGEAEKKAKEHNPLHYILTEGGFGVQDPNITNDNGLVTIHGRIENGALRAKIDKLIASQPGVTHVSNQLEVMDISDKNIKMAVSTRGSNLNVRSGAGTQFDIKGKFSNASQVLVVRKMSDQWAIVRGEGVDNKLLEGYCHTDYLKNVD